MCFVEEKWEYNIKSVVYQQGIAVNASDWKWTDNKRDTGSQAVKWRTSVVQRLQKILF